MGTDNYSRVMMGLLITALLGATLIIVVLLALLVSAPQSITYPVQQSDVTTTPEPRLLEEHIQPVPQQTVVLVESQMSKTITAQKIIAITTPVILEPVYGE